MLFWIELTPPGSELVPFTWAFEKNIIILGERIMPEITDSVSYLAHLESRIKYLEMISNSGVQNPSFFKRAFIIWGHWLFANIVIGVIVMTAYILIAVVFLGAVFHK